MKRNLRFRGCHCPKRIRPLSLLFTIFLLTVGGKGAFGQQSLSGTVVDSSGTAISGATVTIRGTSARTLTDDRGRFTLRAPEATGTLVVSYLGHQPITEKFDTATGAEFHFTLVPTDNLLEEVEVSTGYQTLSSRMATGSFERIRSADFNHNFSPNVLQRLEGQSPSLYFNNSYGSVVNHAERRLPSLRGISGFGLNAKPLIVLDNFPYEGDIHDIDPDLIASVHLLKDAASTAVWGARAGGGVIVLTSKKAAYRSALAMNANASIAVSGKPDLLYLPVMASADFIDAETILFERGHYDWKLADTYSYPYVSPVVESLAQRRSGTIGDADLAGQLSGYRGKDIRGDYLRHIYRPQVVQQYGLSVQGGSETARYGIHANHYGNRHNVVTSSNRRTSLRTDLSFRPVDGLEIRTDLRLTLNDTDDIGGDINVRYGSPLNLPPYLSLFSPTGTPANIGTRFRSGFADTVGNGGLLDWTFNPAAEIGRSDTEMRTTDLLINTGLSYRILPGMTLSAEYLHQAHHLTNDRYYSAESYFARDLINEYSRYENGAVVRGIPLGGIYMPSATDFRSHSGRVSFAVDREWAGVHRLDAFAAAEIRGNTSVSSDNWHYGYDPKYLSTQYVDPLGEYPTFFGSSGRIPYEASFDDGMDRYTSVLANAAYLYAKRYAITASVRKDASNLFGVQANRRGQPFWSAGMAWHVDQEGFFPFPGYMHMKIRASYGHSGNTNNQVPAIPVITLMPPNSITGLPFATANTPPNPGLSWEKVGTFNAGIDIGLQNGLLAMTIDAFRKRSTNLVANGAVDLSSGFQTLRRNSADIAVDGLDMSVRVSPVRRENLRWAITVNAGHARQTVTRFQPDLSLPADYLWRAGQINPIEGRDAFGVMAFRWAGLDPETGAARGWLAGEMTSDYRNLVNRSTLDDFEYLGSGVPRWTGNLMQELYIGRIGIRANLMAKLGYSFFRNSIDYYGLLTVGNGHADFGRRWRQPGDELSTDVPAMPEYADLYQSTFYSRAAHLVEKGDHVRLQEATVSYRADAVGRFKQLRISATVSNPGILWRANRKGLDPDLAGSFTALPMPITVILGLSANL